MTSPARAVEPLPYEPSDLGEKLGSDWDELLRRGFRWMLLGRALDSRMQMLQRQGRVGFYGAATGNEAVNVAGGLASRPEDWVIPGLREQLVALVRGHPLPTYVHHLFADSADPALGRNMPCHPTAREVNYVSMSSVVGTQISHATGVAYGQKLRRDGGATLAFFGDGATSSNDFHAGLNFAGVFDLPVVFCCANNQWAISHPVAKQSAVPSLVSKSSAYGVSGRQVDGTDFVETYQALSSALDRARRGDGPSLLEFVVFRMTPHSSSDDPGRYQPADWPMRATRRDPVERLSAWLLGQGLISEQDRTSWEATADAEVRSAIQVAEATPAPTPESLTEDVYASRSYPRSRPKE
jgi:pyruvate dehydrogenase E1 component alpha subunit/2-oxoisovalerate dehydrogenase E1 component alpha subunit